MRIGILAGPGVSVASSGACKSQLEKAAFKTCYLSTDKLEIGLCTCDVLVVPGGETHQILSSLKRSRRKIRAFVEKGGIYVGICAGAVIATQKKQCLSLISVQCHMDSKYEKLNMHEKTSLLPLKGLHSYQGGPVLKLSKASHKTKVQVIARFEQDLVAQHLKRVVNNSESWTCLLCLHPNSVSDTSCRLCRESKQESENTSWLPPPGDMVGKIAICKSSLGRGKVLLFSTHPEFTERALVDFLLELVIS